MSGHHSSLNIKNYQFMQPSVAVWQDFNDLDLRESTTRSQRSGKSKQKNHNPIGILQEGFDERKLKKSGIMKRKKQSMNNPLGAFIRPSEFSLDHSVLLPSRAGIRLKPIKNAPVPVIEDKKGNKHLPSVVEKPKFYVPEKPKAVAEMNYNIDHLPSWNPHELRENTELAREPSFILDLNYGSDGDVEMMDIQESKPTKNREPSVESTSNQVKEGFIKMKFPSIAPDSNPSTTKNDKDTKVIGEPERVDPGHQVDTECPVGDNLSLAAETLPRLDLNINESVKNNKVNTKTNDTKSKQGLNSNKQTLPYLKASKDPVKKTERFTIKSRYQVAKSNVTKHGNVQATSKNNVEFIVGDRRQLNSKRANNQTRRSKASVLTSKIFAKRKHTKDAEQEKKSFQVESVPSSSDDPDLVILPEGDQLINDEAPADKDANPSPSSLKVVDDQILPATDVVKSTILEEFEFEHNDKRMKTPRLLEFPLYDMKTNEREIFEQKRAKFRKLDIDGDGHLSFFELMKSFPEELTKYHIDYLKMIYQKACNSTFFGLEEFLCVEEMCNKMVTMNAELEAVFSRLDQYRLQDKLQDYLVIFQEAKVSTALSATPTKLQEKTRRFSDSTTLKELSAVFSSINQELKKGIQKSDYLLMIPYFVDKNILPESLLD